MRGLDTNVVVRYLTQDEPRQARKANAFIAESVAGGEPCYLSVIVLCELVCVLREAYGYERNAVVPVLEKLLDTAQLVLEDKDLVRRAVADYAAGPGDFADYLLGGRNRRSGCARTSTFDRKLRKSELFEIL